MGHENDTATTINLNINVNLPNVGEKLDRILNLLTASAVAEKKIMATLQDLQNSIDEINTATDTVAAEITALMAQIATGITPDQADTVNAALGGIVTRLKSIGSPSAPAGNVPPTDATPPATT